MSSTPHGGPSDGTTKLRLPGHPTSICRRSAPDTVNLAELLTARRRQRPCQCATQLAELFAGLLAILPPVQAGAGSLASCRCPMTGARPVHSASGCQALQFHHFAYPAASRHAPLKPLHV